MNRYYWLAIGLFALLAVSVATIGLLNVSDARTAEQLNLGLTALSTIAGVGSAIFGVVGAREKRADQPPPLSSHTLPYHLATPLSTTDEEKSREIYVAQIREQIRDLEDPATAFVSLTTSADPAGAVVRSELLPTLEWMNRRHQQEYAQAVPEDVGLFQIPERFSRSVLLGEPGSGKSTCLRQLALATLNQVESGSTTRMPLLVSLSEWQDPAMGARAFLRDRLESLVGPASYYVVNFETLLASGRFVLLLDGLNEMPERKPSEGEGSHERRGRDTMPALPRPGLPRADPRERSLRELATSTAQQSRFVITCRSHEYLDSLEWQVVRVLPMTPEQTARFLQTHVAPDRVEEVQDAIAANPLLAEMATNPFFLRVIIEVQRPDRRLESRGEVMAYFLKTVLDRESDRHGVDVMSESEIVRNIGPLAFNMLKRGQIGGQAKLPVRGSAQRAAVSTLLDTGLIVQRDGDPCFLHQIIQEFLAAAALRQRAVRKRPATLLADKRWSEVIALWVDLDPDKMLTRLIRCLKARNLPWRRPGSPTLATTLVCYSVALGCALILIPGVLVYGWLFAMPSTLPVLFGAVTLPPIAFIVGAMVVTKVLWRRLVYHRGVIVNAAYVLGLSRNPAAIPALVPSFSRLFQTERGEVAKSLSSFGAAALSHVMQGLESRTWRVRSGCVQTLTALLHDDAVSQEATDILLALAEADDPQLARPLSEALAQCQNNRTPVAIAALVARIGASNPMFGMYRLQPLTDARAPETTRWSYEDVVGRLTGFSEVDQPPIMRMLGVRVIGALRLPGCEELLTDIADDGSEVNSLRTAAVAGLGFAQTSEAVLSLARLAERHIELSDAVIKAFAVVRDNTALKGLLATSSSESSLVRKATASALGALQSPDALEPLTKLGGDASPTVRSAAALGLGALGLSDALPRLQQLAHDGVAEVRVAALQALDQRYPDLAGPVLMELATDLNYQDRERAVRLLGRHSSAAVEIALIGLGGDTEKNVREAAAETLTGIRTGSRDSVRRRGWLLHPLRAARDYTTRKLQLAGLRSMWQEERLVGTPGGEIFTRIQTRILTDAELKRRYRIAIAVVNSLFVIFIVAVGIVTTIIVLALLALSSLFLDIWPFAVAILTLGAVVALASQRWRSWRRFRALKAMQAIALALFVVCFVGGVVYTWWIWLLLLSCALATWSVQTFRSRIRKRTEVSAALERSGVHLVNPVVADAATAGPS
jgi:HEAT repeats/NACHT domain